MTRTVKFKHFDLNLIIRANLVWQEGMTEPTIAQIKFTLPRKATKLEKFLLKYVEIYAYDVIRNHLHDSIVNSHEYTKVIQKQKHDKEMDVIIKKAEAKEQRARERRKARKKEMEFRRKVCHEKGFAKSVLFGNEQK